MPVKACFPFCAIFALGTQIHAERVPWMGVKRIKRQEPFAFATGLSGLCEPTLRLSAALRKVVVVPCVDNVIRYFKVLNTVIELIAVFVVNNLMAFKWSAKMSFHDVTVFKNLLAVHMDFFIAKCNPPIAFIHVVRVAVKKPAQIVFIAPSTSANIVFTILNSAFHIANINQRIRKIKR